MYMDVVFWYVGKVRRGMTFFPISHTIFIDSLRISFSMDLSLDVFGFMTRHEFVMIFDSYSCTPLQ